MTGVVELTDAVVQAAAEGRSLARAQVLEAIASRVRLMVAARLSATPNRLHIVDETSQEVLLALAAGLPRLEHQTVGGLNAYLSGIVSRQVAKTIAEAGARRARHAAATSLDSTVTGFSAAGPLGQLLPASGASPRSAADLAEQVAQLFTELGRLKPEYREVITLAFFDQLSTGAIAELLGISRAAASMLLLRAVRTLRRNITGSSGIGGDHDGS